MTSEDRLQELLRKRQTSGVSDAEAQELGELLANVPRRPDEPQRPADQWIKPGKRWERGWAIVGIVLAFPFLLTIPGWIGIDHYRKWQNYERGRPTGFIAWGILAPSFMALILLAGLVINLRSSTHFPDSIAGQPKMTSSTFTQLAERMEKEGAVGSDKPQVAFYGIESRPEFLVAVWDSPLTDDAFLSFFREFARSFSAGGGSVELDSLVSESRDSVSYQCAPYTIPNGSGFVCAWHDRGSLGVVVEYEAGLSTAVALTSQIRDAVRD